MIQKFKTPRYSIIIQEFKTLRYSKIIQRFFIQGFNNLLFV